MNTETIFLRDMKTLMHASIAYHNSQSFILVYLNGNQNIFRHKIQNLEAKSLLQQRFFPSDNSTAPPSIVECERKFLLLNDSWKNEVSSVHKLHQAYLCMDPSKWQMRVRIDDEQGWLTIKGPRINGSNPEFEYPISLLDASRLWNCIDGPRLSKIRSLVHTSYGKWEIDEFLDPVISHITQAEIEVPFIDFPFEKPLWIGDEVTYDSQYRNDVLALKVFEGSHKHAPIKIK